MEVLIALPFIAYVGERLSEKVIKPIIKAFSPSFAGVSQEIKDYFEAIACAVPGFAICLLSGIDVFAEVGLPLAYHAGPIVTAFVVGFGTNLVHDLLGYLDQLRGAN
jgi:hypothetical protein